MFSEDVLLQSLRGGMTKQSFSRLPSFRPAGETVRFSEAKSLSYE
ncbi:hypothetical protein TASCI_10261 [Tenacibaculum ascidiaceicola]